MVLRHRAEADDLDLAPRRDRAGEGISGFLSAAAEGCWHNVSQLVLEAPRRCWPTRHSLGGSLAVSEARAIAAWSASACAWLAGALRT